MACSLRSPHVDPASTKERRRGDRIEYGELIRPRRPDSNGHRGWIYSLAVLPVQRINGIGSRLLRFAEARLAELGCIKVNLQIVEGNEAAVLFYERHGYETEPRTSMGKRLLRG